MCDLKPHAAYRDFGVNGSQEPPLFADEVAVLILS